MSSFKDTFIALRNLHHYITEPRFSDIIKSAGIAIDRRELAEAYLAWGKGWFYFINSKFYSEKIIDALLEYEKAIEIDSKHYRFRIDSNEDRYKEKVIYSIGEEVFQEEIITNDYLGLKRLLSIYETADTVLGRMPFACQIQRNDEGTRSDKYANLYIGDFFNVSDGYSLSDCGVFIITDDANNGYAFKELLYNSKYGYLTPKGSINVDESSDNEFTPEFLNIDESHAYSSYVVSRGQSYNYMGNILCDINMLKNPKSK